MKALREKAEGLGKKVATPAVEGQHERDKEAITMIIKEECGFKKFPKCEECEIFLQMKELASRVLVCETARACGQCPKDQWCVDLAKKLQELFKNYKICDLCEVADFCSDSSDDCPTFKILKQLLEALK
jgi:hypothetical protein